MDRGPLTQRLYDAAGVSPIWIGLGLFFGQLALCWAYATALGVDDLGRRVGSAERSPVGSLNVVFALLIAYAPTATAYSQRVSRRLLEDLRPALDCSDADFMELTRRTLDFDRVGLRIAGILMVVGSAAVVAGGLRENGLAVGPWVLYENVAATWLGARTIVHELQVARRFSQLGLEHARVSLVNLRPLAPLGSRGVQAALVLILEISIFSLIGLVGTAESTNVLLQVIVVGVAVFAAWTPMTGVHGRIREEKRRKLDQLALDIEVAEQRMMSSAAPNVADEGTRLSALLALKHDIEAAREWPIDLGAVVRFALYIALGLASWMGAAVVERLLDAALG